ncbi:hypothetical protein [Rhodopila sp.]|uniref:hypothetical protein n=1 Tax=Rhodopila sp. TaxID=2480087 RepID=UPI002CBFC438|nr:hypothetical protein [Rhodopila sp.]HVZ06526.1 hypothetical protein [Rhodopila sp.]
MSAKIAVIALSAAASFSLPAMAKIEKHPTPQTQLYAFHTRPASGCPGLDWHVTVDPNKAISGFVAWDRMQHMARLDGQIERDNTFKVNAQEVGGTGKTAVITGRYGGNYLAIAISGTGTPCDDVILNVPRAGGGLGGGGG